MKLEGLFTPEERKALAFLLGAAFLGLAVMAWPQSGSAAQARERLTVRVNRAEAGELVALPGIGPVLAKRIVEERGRRGFFLTLADLKRVKGITPKTLEKLERLVRFD